MCERSTQLMKLKNLSLLSVSIAALLTACKPTQQRIYEIGNTYTFGDWNISATLDKDNERFVLDFRTSKSNPDSFIFYFYFSTDGSAEHQAESSNRDETNQFIYRLNTGDQIQFDDNGFYYFQENITICAFYTYANQDIKDAINASDYSIQFGCGHWAG